MDKYYDAAFRKAEKIHETGTAEVRKALESVFPRLREQKDVRIKKAVIRHFKLCTPQSSSFSGFDKKTIIEWLEKCVTAPEEKPEEKPADNLRTTVCGNDYLCIKGFWDGRRCTYTKGSVYHCPRDGYLYDDGGICWSCGDEDWFREHMTEFTETGKTQPSGQWKPSETQLNVLGRVILDGRLEKSDEDVLYALLKDLKMLNLNEQ